MQLADHLTFGFDPVLRTVTLLGREYSLSSLLRTVIFLCGYMLLRPYLLQLSAKFQASDHARDVGDDDDDAAGEDEDDEDDQGWGAKARRRAKEVAKRISEMEQEADENEDKELAALLED